MPGTRGPGRGDRITGARYPRMGLPPGATVDGWSGPRIRVRSCADMAKKTKSARTAKPRARRERRFEPQASARPGLVYVMGAVGAAAMGAGAWEQFGPLLSDAG